MYLEAYTSFIKLHNFDIHQIQSLKTIVVYNQLFDRWFVAILYFLDLVFRESVVHFLQQALSVTIQKQKTKTYPAFNP